MGKKKRLPRRLPKQYEQALKLSPRLVEARNNLATIHCQKGEIERAISELEEAIRLKPDSGRAHYELGVALARTGNRAGGIEHLKLAAQGPDQDAKAAAVQVLRSLGQ